MSGTRVSRAKTPTKPSVKQARAKRAPAAPKRAAAKAQKAVAKAKASGARGRKVTARQRMLRDAAILTCSEAGWSAPEIAAEFELTDRQVRRILNDVRDRPSSLDAEPMQILDGLLRGYRDAIVDLELMAVLYRDDAPSAAIKARVASVETREKFASLLSAVGKLPENLELFRAQSVLEQIADRMVETMELVQAGELEVAEAVEVFREATSPSQGPAELRAA
jgi:hypothetical protein